MLHPIFQKKKRLFAPRLENDTTKLAVDWAIKIGPIFVFFERIDVGWSVPTTKDERGFRISLFFHIFFFCNKKGKRHVANVDDYSGLSKSIFLESTLSFPKGLDGATVYVQNYRPVELPEKKS